MRSNSALSDFLYGTYIVKALLLIDDTEWDKEECTRYGGCLVNLERHDGILYWVKEKTLTFQHSLEYARSVSVGYFPDLRVLGGVWKREMRYATPNFPGDYGSVKYEDYPL